MFRSRLLYGLLLVGCLALAGFVLRASLPENLGRPSAANRTSEKAEASALSFLHGQVADPNRWRHTTQDERQQAVASIRGQLRAFRSDDYERAFAYQGRALQARDPSPDGLRALISHLYPEFAQCQSATFGEAQADAHGQHVDVPVTVNGKNGLQTRALYLMVREGGTYHVGGVTDIVRTPLPGRH